MLKFVKKKTTPATSPPPPVEISRPTNLVVSKKKLVRTDGDFILIMEDDKVVGILDKRDLELAVVPLAQAPTRPVSITSQPTSASTSPQSSPYLIPTSSARSVSELDAPLLSSPVGVSPSKYKTLPAGFAAKQQAPLFQWQFSQGTNRPDTSSHYRSTSVEQLLSPLISTSSRNRSESTLQPQGSQKYDTISFSPTAQPSASNSASSQSNVEIKFGDDRSLPPPPKRAPPIPLSLSPYFSESVRPPLLDYTEVQTVEVLDPELAQMSLEEMRKHAEDIESYIQGQIQEKWCQDKAQTERWIENIAGKVAKAETMNTIRMEMTSRKRPSLSNVFEPYKSSCPSIAPSDPEPNNDYERLYLSTSLRQASTDSDEDIKEFRF